MNEKEMYLLLCGWSRVQSHIDNPFWKGEPAWFRTDVMGLSYFGVPSYYKTTNQAFEIERVKREGQ